MQRAPLDADLLTRFIGSLAHAGRPSREFAVRLDLLRTVGPTYAWKRLRLEPQIGRVLEGYRNALYASIWGNAARELGAVVSATGNGFFEIRNGERSTRVRQHCTILNGEVAVELCGEKTEVHRLLKNEGLCVPDYAQFDYEDIGPAVDFLEQGPLPCVVKPVRSGAGFGVTTGVCTVSQLLRARLRAAQFGQRMVIERQGIGNVYRLLFLDGELLDVVQRSSPHVRGDGRSSIAQLTVDENRRRMAARGEAGLWPLWLDLDAVFTLEAAGLSPASVPPEKVRVQVKTATNQNAAEENVTFSGTAPELVAEAAAAVRLVGLRVGGVDVVTPDATTSLRSVGGVILEVNSPGLHHHYLVANRRKATPVAIPILRALFED